MLKDRKNEVVDQDLLKKIVSIYTFLSNDKIPGPMSNCLKDLEEKVLQESRSFFAYKAT